MFGRKPAFLTGLIGFAAVSAVRDLAQSFEWPVAALHTALGRGASAVPLRPFIRTL
jgi:hypothetical protein